MDAKSLSTVVAAIAPVAGSISPVAGLVMFGVQEAIKYEPAIAEEFHQLFSEGIPTEEDWAASLARLQQPYEALAPNSAAQIAAAAGAAPAPSLTVIPPPAGATPPPAPTLAPTLPAPAHPPDIGGNAVL